MDYNFINQNTSSLSTNVIDYSQVQGTFPVTYNDTSSYNPYPSTSYNNDSSPIESYQNDYLAQTYADSSNTYEQINNTGNDEFATVVRIYDENSPNTETYQNEVTNIPTENLDYNIASNDNIIDSNNIIETGGYQTSYQQNEYSDNIGTFDNIDNTNILNNDITEEYPVTSTTPIDYNTNITSNSLPYDYNINSAPVEYSTNTNEVNEVTNDYNNYNNNYYETNTNTNIGIGNDNNFYNTDSVQNNIIPEMRNSFSGFTPQYNSLTYSDNNNNNFSNYNTNSVPLDITAQFNDDDDTEIIPVEEVEYIPVKRTKYIKTKKVKPVPQKKTVIIPKKVIVPIPVKKIVYVKKKEEKPKVIPSLTKVTKIPNEIKPQEQMPKLPVRKNIMYNSIVPAYKPKVYRIKL